MVFPSMLRRGRRKGVPSMRGEAEVALTDRYLHASMAALRNRGATEDQVAEFMDQWHRLPSGVPRVPCPNCYLRGGWGSLQFEAEVWCAVCSQRVPVGPPEG